MGALVIYFSEWIAAHPRACREVYKFPILTCAASGAELTNIQHGECVPDDVLRASRDQFVP